MLSKRALEKLVERLVDALADEGNTIDDYYYTLVVRDGELVIVRLDPDALPSTPRGQYEAVSVGRPDELSWHPDQ